MKAQSEITVRYAETDQMGIAHHSNYAVWFEVGRTDLTRRLGLTYTEMEEMGVLLPLLELHCRYRQAARYEDELTVETCLVSVSRVRLEFSYAVRRCRDGALLCTGSTLHGIVGRDLKPFNLQKRFPELYETLQQAAEPGEPA